MGDIPEWAFKRVCELTNKDGSRYEPDNFKWLTPSSARSYSIGEAFARYIAAHEEEPVDPLLIEAREIAAENQPGYADGFIRGDWDGHSSMQALLRALKRGIEIAEKRHAS